MKSYLFVIVSLCFLSCTDKLVSTKESTGLIATNSLTEKQNVAWSSMKEALLDHIATSRSENRSYAFSNRKELDEIKVSIIPYFDYNDTIFYESPSPESIIKSLHVSNDKLWFVGKTSSDKVALMCEAGKTPNGWKLRRDLQGIGYFENQLSWLWDKTKNLKPEDVRLLNIYGLTYFMIISNDKPIYYTFLGKAFSEDEFCGYLLSKKRQNDINQEFKENMKRDPQYIQKLMDKVHKKVNKSK